MCGITALIGPRSNIELIEAMTTRIAHRGPDGAGYVVKDGVALGHRRLSIIDLSDAGRQPMASADGRYLIVFNGEIYNYRELRAELEDGTPWISATDTEVILRAYALWGQNAVKRFIGMFAFVILDTTTGVVFGARDRLGIKPMYLAEQAGTFAIASEIKALMPFLSSIQPNEMTVARYLVDGLYDDTDETFFAGVQRIPAATAFTIVDGRLEFYSYWDVWEEREKWRNTVVDRVEAAELFRKLLTDAVRLRLRSDVPIGVNLSSGFDSTLMLSLVNAESSERDRLHAFTMGFEDRQFDESYLVKRIVEMTGNPWHVSILTPEEVFPLAAEVMRSQDEPFGGIPTIAYHKMNRLARASGVTVLIEGQGGDELFGGYAYYRPMWYRDLLRDMRWSKIRREMYAFGGRSQGGTVRGLIPFMRDALTLGVRYQDGTRFKQRQVINPSWLRSTYRAPTPERSSASSAFVRRMIEDTRATKLPRVLRFNDHASMAFGLELRLPLLDHRIVEFAFAVPPEWKIVDTIGKSFLRKCVKGIVPDDPRLLQKKSAPSPQSRWFAGPLRTEINAMLTSASFCSRPFVDAASAREMFAAFCANGGRQNSFFIWQLINLEMWYRAFFDGAHH